MIRVQKTGYRRDHTANPELMLHSIKKNQKLFFQDQKQEKNAHSHHSYSIEYWKS